jgi:hypothetical protein
VCVYTDIETRSFNHCDRGKAISITYSECASIALVIQHSERMHYTWYIVICGGSGSGIFFNITS